MSEEKDVRKKLIRIKAVENLVGTYKSELNTGEGIFFALCGPNVEETDKSIKCRLQISKFVSCREQLTETPRVALNKLPDTYLINSNKHTVDMDKYRLLLGVSGNKDLNTSKQKIFSGKRALNLLEKAAGWAPSVITTVKHEDYTNDHVWLLTGDSRWMKAPQMISLSSLILRISFRFGPLQVESLDALLNQFDTLAKIPKDTRTLDHTYIGTIRKHIIPLMKNVEKVFSGDPIQYFPNETETGWNGYGGIDTLIKCGTGNEKLHARLKKYVFNKLSST